MLAVNKFILSVIVFLALSACGGGRGDAPPAPTPAPAPAPAPIPAPAPDPAPADPMGNTEDGEAFFTTKLDNGNQFSCANCHAITEDSDGLASDGLHRPAHPLFNAVKRSSFHNGNTSTIFDAVNTCLEEWMDGSALAESDQNWLDLEAYLDQQSDDADAALVVSTQVAPITDFSNGSEEQGQAHFNQTCAACHGENASGTELAGRLAGRGVSATRVAEKARTSGPSDSSVYAGLAGGNMPFWSQERLTNADLVNIATYVESAGADNTAGTCEGTDNALLGKTATLVGATYGISGTVTVKNNCTLEVKNFSYNGQGPAVKFYLGRNGNYSNDDYAVGSELNRAFTNESFNVTFNDPTMLNNMDGISVWCFQFNVSFADDTFK